MTAYIFQHSGGVNGGYVHLGDTMIYLAAAFPCHYLTRTCVAEQSEVAWQIF